MSDMKIDLVDVKKKAFSGVGILVLRNFLLQPISFAGFFFLSIFLQRWELGVFWAVSEIIGFLGYFSDIGLAAAVIQKKKELEKEEIRATFTLQQILVLSLILITILLTPFLQQKFNFNDQGKLLLFSLLFGFFAASLKTIPSVLLERKLEFEKLATVDLAEQVVFTGIAVFLAWRGFSLQSWVWAVFARSFVGLILIYIFSPWSIGLNFGFKKIFTLIKFGVPFQINSLLAVLKDRLLNIFLWGLVGSEGIGILGWAQKWAQMPLRFLMDPVVRVSFPAYSRLQTEKEKLKLALEQSIYFVNLLIFPMLGAMAFLMPIVVEVFPKYHKWFVGIVPFWFYLLNFAFGVSTTPMVNAFNAVGKIKKSLNLMVMWTVLSWIFVPVGARFYGTNGAASALALVSASSFIAWIMVKREFKISLTRVFFKPLLLTLGVIGILLIGRHLFPPSLLGLMVNITSGGLFLLLLYWGLAKKDLSWLLKNIKSQKSA